MHRLAPQQRTGRSLHRCLTVWFLSDSALALAAAFVPALPPVLVSPVVLCLTRRCCGRSGRQSCTGSQQIRRRSCRSAGVPDNRGGSGIPRLTGHSARRLHLSPRCVPAQQERAGAKTQTQTQEIFSSHHPFYRKISTKSQALQGRQSSIDNSTFRPWNQNGTNLEPEWNRSIE